MISRIWHGWTTPANADAYEALLKSEIFVGISERDMPGYHGIQLLRRDVGDEVEFVTIMEFDSIDAVRIFVGNDPKSPISLDDKGYEACVVPPSARKVLKRFDERSQHYEVRVEKAA
jgi:hypothetical protein